MNRISREKKHSPIFWIWSAIALSLGACGLGICSLYYATGSFYQPMFLSYLQNRTILLLNLLPVVLLALFLWMVTRRTWLAFFLGGLVTLGLSAGNFFKLAFRNDPVVLGDLLLLKEAGNMAGKYQLFFTKGLAFGVLFLLAGTIFLFFCANARPRKWARVAGLAGVLLAVLPLKPMILSNEVYRNEAANNALISPMSATDVYISKGFIYPFLHSVRDLSAGKPEHYNPARARELLEGYTDGVIPPEQQVNVVGVMLEAFQDFSKFGTPALSYDLYAPYHALEAEGYSGDLVTNIFAGGTVDTERCFLTGFSSLGSMRGPTNSYPWYFRSQGYTAEGMHPCFQWFYNRLNINENLGFERYRFVENYFGQFTGGDVAFDKVFFPELISSLQDQEGIEGPVFSFSVSYQGHGPYNTDQLWWGNSGDFVQKSDAYTPEQQNILDNYFGSVADTIGYVTQLADFMRNSAEPYVLVLFGDHNPWMGDGNSVYSAMGLDLDLGTDTGFRNYYSTRYLIWANDAAKKALGRDIQGEGPEIGPYFLMNELFKVCGWTGSAYLQATNQIAETVPVVHQTGVYIADGKLQDTLTPEQQALVADYQSLQYYWQTHFSEN
ncbi:MAG: LTA synthase family protein [Oscillospiraceae bacterium]